MTPGDTVRIKGTDRTYTVLAIATHYEGTPYEAQWATLRPPAPATHTAHWPIAQLEPADD
jgi:hypothetical protein